MNYAELLKKKFPHGNNILDSVFIKESDDLIKCEIMPKLIANNR